MKKPTIAVIFGSRSTEHDISILTAIASVIKPLQRTKKYDVLPVYVAKDGRWFAGAAFRDIALYQSGKLDTVLEKHAPVSLLFKKGGGLRLTQVKKPFARPASYDIDVVFPAMHGTHGEDGELMAVCELANVPYVGCDMEASVIAMDKVLAKQVAAVHGIPTATFHYFTKQDYEANTQTWLEKINTDAEHRLQYPLFVKPSHSGSSIGITRVTDKKDLANAIEVALHYDTKALVEEAVPNLIEVTLPVMGNDELTPALLEQPLTKSEDFFDFEAKYMQGGKGKGKAGSDDDNTGEGETAAKSGAKTDQGQKGAQGYSRIPAELPKGLYEAAESVGLAVYRALGCSGIARVDMQVDSKARVVYFNEVNPLPGSLYAHNWSRAGISNVDLASRLVALAMEHFAKKTAQTTSFSSNYLQQF